MRFIAISLLVLAPLSTWAFGKAYINAEDNQIVSVFNKPGMNWKNCATTSGCSAVGWPDNSANIVVLTESKKMKVQDPYTGNMVEEEYVYVMYEYNRVLESGAVLPQKGEGWIDAAYISKTKQSTFYGSGQTEADPNCPPEKKKETTPKEVQKSVAPLKTAIENTNIKESADAIKKAVGQCVINPKNPPANFAEGNIFDTYVLPGLKKQAVPKVVKEDGTMMTQADLVTIDALSRTMYAEMARCYKHGLHYPMTVAKIAVNRANNENREKEFIKGTHNGAKSRLAKVVTTPSQFNLWMRTIDSKPNGALLHALCPPSDKTKAFWTGAAPPKFEQDIWDNTLRIATEAVLHPKKFSNRTKQVKQYHYTSGLDGFFGMKQVFPFIEDHKVSKNACVQVWDDKS